MYFRANILCFIYFLYKEIEVRHSTRDDPKNLAQSGRRSVLTLFTLHLRKAEKNSENMKKIRNGSSILVDIEN